MFNICLSLYFNSYVAVETVPVHNVDLVLKKLNSAMILYVMNVRRAVLSYTGKLNTCAAQMKTLIVENALKSEWSTVHRFPWSSVALKTSPFTENDTG